MKFNKYQCPLSCTDCGKVNVFNVLESVKPPYFHQISLCFFKCFCKTICSTEKILDMCGPLVYEKLGLVKIEIIIYIFPNYPIKFHIFYTIVGDIFKT